LKQKKKKKKMKKFKAEKKRTHFQDDSTTKNDENFLKMMTIKINFDLSILFLKFSNFGYFWVRSFFVILLFLFFFRSFLFLSDE